MGRFFNRKEKKEINFIEDERLEAARILADFYREWQSEWEETKLIYNIPKNEDLKYLENDQQESVLKSLAKLLCDFEFDDGEKFRIDLEELAENIRPTKSEYSKPFTTKIAALLKKHIGKLMLLEEKRLKFEEPSLNPEIATRILNDELGISNFEFVVSNAGTTIPISDIEFSKKLMV